jgi:hypothetical protein
MVKEFISSNHLDFIAIQETKLEVVNESLYHFLWGNPFCEWSFTPAIGNSGGILSIWCSSKGRRSFLSLDRALEYVLSGESTRLLFYRNE